MSGRLLWERDGRDWPNREASRFVEAGGLRWHVQVAGNGRPALLLHGTAASTHSWAGLLPLLAERYTVVAPDLPGHGFTSMPPPEQMTLDGVSAALASLLEALGTAPVVAVGHSAGAAVLVRMSARRLVSPPLVVSLNGALLPFRGGAGKFFSPLAKLLVLNPVVPWFAAWGASSFGVRNLIEATGSKLDARGLAFYQRLVSNPGHVEAALALMAGWDLPSLQPDLRTLRPTLLLVAGANDGTVPPDQAFAVRDIAPRATVEYLKGLGHLAHEEAPALIRDVIVAADERASAPSA